MRMFFHRGFRFSTTKNTVLAIKSPAENKSVGFFYAVTYQVDTR